jgi:RimJ/RimL family protein N-acetyltransferase
MQTLFVGEPGEFKDSDIEDFVRLVEEGGEVSKINLRNRVGDAKFIAFARIGSDLIGVAGLKHPEETHRASVQNKSEVPLPSEDFPFELGWVVIAEKARGKGLSLPLCQLLIAAAGSRGIYATSRTQVPRMHKTLSKLQFQRVGMSWQSTENDDDLGLFVRRGATKTSV